LFSCGRIRRQQGFSCCGIEFVAWFILFSFRDLCCTVAADSLARDTSDGTLNRSEADKDND
jgi:hypothetical protein